MYGGAVVLGTLASPTYITGGAFLSVDGGLQFTPIGLDGMTVERLLQNRDGSRLYAAAYGSGIFVATPGRARLTDPRLAASPRDPVKLPCPGCLYADNASMTIDGQPAGVTRTRSTFDFAVPDGLGTGPHAARIAYGSSTADFTLEVPALPAAWLNAMTSVKYEQKATWAPGDIVFLFGARMAGRAAPAPGAEHVTPGLPWGTRLAGTRVLVDEREIPLQFAWTDSATGASQVNVQLPYTLDIGQHKLRVERIGEAATYDLTFTVTPRSPVLLGNASYPVFFQNVTQDPSGGTFVSTAQPAREGDVLTVYVTGLGTTNPPVPAGAVPSALSLTTSPAQISLFSANAPQGMRPEVIGPALSPQFPGLYQVSFHVPAGVAGDRQTAVQTAFNFGSGFLPPFLLQVIR
jgi:uncharacterized protein (TIGR03437 family)